MRSLRDQPLCQVADVHLNAAEPQEEVRHQRKFFLCEQQDGVEN
jgi:hypothetical protein